MTVEEMKEMINTGEKIDVEFKKSENGLNKDIYETVCFFNNRNGGHIFLGVEDKTRKIVGVNPKAVDKMKKDFTTAINNANKINPPMYLTPQDQIIDGKTIIYIRMPEGTQLRRLNGRIMDRTHEGDITDNAELVYKMYARKQSTFFVNKVYPNLGLEFLDFDVIRRAKKTDAIFRIKDMDRYDDQEVIITNLVDGFRRLMDFGKKHLNDSFVMEGDQSISARDKILREIISNILAHRDYANAYTAQFVIEKDKIFTKNSNLPHGHGELKLNKFEPFPKNPPISKAFREIGYADELGSGMRNTNKYTKMYSGGTPIFVEDNIFQIIIPMEGAAGLQVSPDINSKETSQKTVQETNQETNQEVNCYKSSREKILFEIKSNPCITQVKLAEKIGLSRSGVKYVLKQLQDEGLLKRVGSTKKGQWIIQENK